MTDRAPAKNRAIWTWSCSLSSSVLLLILVMMAGHIRVALGRWPTFGEDCNMLLFRVHELLLVAVGGFALYVAAPLWVLFLLFRRLRLGWKCHLAQSGVFALGWLLIFAAGKYDPTPFTYWLLD